MDSGKVLLGVLAGFAVGALAGVLLAPAKGAETRGKILRKGEDLYDSVKNKFDDLLDDTADKFEEAKENATDRAEEKQPQPEKAKKGQK